MFFIYYETFYINLLIFLNKCGMFVHEINKRLKIKYVKIVDLLTLK